MEIYFDIYSCTYFSIPCVSISTLDNYFYIKTKLSVIFLVIYSNTDSITKLVNVIVSLFY